MLEFQKYNRNAHLVNFLAFKKSYFIKFTKLISCTVLNSNNLSDGNWVSECKIHLQPFTKYLRLTLVSM